MDAHALQQPFIVIPPLPRMRIEQLEPTRFMTTLQVLSRWRDHMPAGWHSTARWHGLRFAAA